MTQEQDIERLIRKVTETVLARLGPGDRSPATTRILLLLPVSSARLQDLGLQVEEMLLAGCAVRVAADRAVVDEMERRGLRGRFGRDVIPFDEANVGEILADITRRDLLVVGSIGFQSAAAIRDREDGSPFVRIVTQALLGDREVFLVADDLSPGAGVRETRMVSDARRLLVEVERIGITLLALKDLPGLMQRRASAAATLPRSLGGLLTEEEVVRLVAEGEKRLVLPRHTIVTPLARSRAAELGLEILKEEP